MTGDIVERMRTALRKCIGQFETLEDRFPADAGCIDCTVGTVPNDRNTGLCGYHQARAVLAEAEALGPASLLGPDCEPVCLHGDKLYLIIPILDQPKEPTK